jgi:hypothetical protein
VAGVQLKVKVVLVEELLRTPETESSMSVSAEAGTGRARKKTANTASERRAYLNFMGTLF